MNCSTDIVKISKTDQKLRVMRFWQRFRWRLNYYGIWLCVTDNWILTFWSNVLFSSSVIKCPRRMFLRWGHYVSSKRRNSITQWHSAISQKNGSLAEIYWTIPGYRMLIRNEASCKVTNSLCLLFHKTIKDFVVIWHEPFTKSCCGPRPVVLWQLQSVNIGL